MQFGTSDRDDEAHGTNEGRGVDQEAQDSAAPQTFNQPWPPEEVSRQMWQMQQQMQQQHEQPQQQQLQQQQLEQPQEPPPQWNMAPAPFPLHRPAAPLPPPGAFGSGQYFTQGAPAVPPPVSSSHLDGTEMGHYGYPGKAPLNEQSINADFFRFRHRHARGTRDAASTNRKHASRAQHPALWDASAIGSSLAETGGRYRELQGPGGSAGGSPARAEGEAMANVLGLASPSPTPSPAPQAEESENAPRFRAMRAQWGGPILPLQASQGSRGGARAFGNEWPAWQSMASRAAAEAAKAAAGAVPARGAAPLSLLEVAEEKSIWMRPKYIDVAMNPQLDGVLGGSRKGWPAARDGRMYLSFWGGTRGGCCHLTSNNYGGEADPGSWGQEYVMHVMEVDPLLYWDGQDFPFESSDSEEEEVEVDEESESDDYNSEVDDEEEEEDGGGALSGEVKDEADPMEHV